MNEIFITDASAVFAEKLTPDDTIIKGDKFYFGKLEQDFEPINNECYDLRCNRVLKYLVNKLNLSGFAKDEIGIVIGTTNSGVEEFETTENKHHAELGNPAEFLKWYLGTKNYAACVSTACTSGAKAFSTARKLLQNGVCKAVIAGGVDTLASMPSYGFHALEVLSHERTNPFSKNRNGISLGEGGALFVLTKAAGQLRSEAAKCELDAKMHQNDVGIAMPTYKISSHPAAILLLGIGETSDAYHSATPDPDGVQAVKAIQNALDDANLEPEDIDYINLHGTGTISNDLMEANAIYKVFGDKVPASSTKPLTGHCLGAAASIEAFICYQILKGERNLPIQKFDGEYDEALPKINLVDEKTPQKDVKICMSTSFGFGGTNAAVILATKDIEVSNRHSEGNNNLIPKNLKIGNQKDLSLIAQDNEKILIETACKLEKTQCPHQNNDNKPSPEFLSSPQLTKKFCPLTEREGSITTHKNTFNDTDHVSLHLSLFASGYQDDVGIAMPTYKANQQMMLGKCSQPTADMNHSPFTIRYSPAQNCLPHSAPMVLIDKVLDTDMENQIVKTSVKIHEDKIFFDKKINGISPLVGIEFMAQTIGCYAYFKAGKTVPKIGFLLGSRQYENSLEKFENGKTYIVTAREIYGDNELVSFECLIYNDGEDDNPKNFVAKATINAFQPKDVEKYIKELE